ncbi:MAG: tetratricopeptide repeat protein [Gammaproteobacteria bacterium]|nr:tetratricopeptide repeat protein [Gammaproteobacteria bacterium]
MYNRNAVKSYEKGRVLHQKGQLSDAERAYTKAIKINQDFVEAHGNLGNVLVDRGRLKEASGAYRKALKLLPDHPMLLNNLGNALQLQGKNEEAISCFNAAITQDPDYADAHSNLGNALRELGRVKEAVASYERAIEIDPGLADAYNNLGYVLMDLDEIDDAATNFEKAIEIDPGHTNAYNGLGNAFQMLGQWDEAIESYHQVIALKPDCAEAYYYLSTAKQFSQYDKTVEAMERQSQVPDLSSEKLMHLSFALGKVHAGLANYDKAFSYIQRGNQLKLCSLQYDVANEVNYLNQLKSAFSAGVFAQLDGIGLIEATPVFILGLPRSGKTLSETMLAQHASVYAAGERKFLQKALNDIIASGNPQRMVEQLLGLPRVDIVQFAQQYVSQVQSLARREPVIIDSMPGNFYYIGFIKILFPNAKVIHCYRHPMDACWFIYQKYFSKKGHDYSFDLNTIGDYYQAYSDLMAHWHSVLPGFIYDLQYERLVTETSHEISQLFSFLGLEGGGVCLDRYENNPLHKKEVGCWQHYEKQLSALLRVLS